MSEHRFWSHKYSFWCVYHFASQSRCKFLLDFMSIYELLCVMMMTVKKAMWSLTKWKHASNRICIVAKFMTWWAVIISVTLPPPWSELTIFGYWIFSEGYVEKWMSSERAHCTPTGAEIVWRQKQDQIRCVSSCNFHNLAFAQHIIKYAHVQNLPAMTGEKHIAQKHEVQLIIMEWHIIMLVGHHRIFKHIDIL